MSTVHVHTHVEHEIEHLLVFRLDDRRFALKLAAVERVVQIVSIAPLPSAPEIVLGVINVRGTVLPVVDTRRRFGLGPRPVRLSDMLLLARTTSRALALLVDEVEGMLDYPRMQIQAAQQILPGARYVDGVAKLGDGLVLIHDLDTFLSLDEESRLQHSLASEGANDNAGR